MRLYKDLFFFIGIACFFLPFFVFKGLFEAYYQFNLEHGLLTSFIKFFILATLGELIGLRGKPLVTRVVRWNDSMPQYHVGHLARVERITQAIADVPGLSLVSNALHGVGIAPVIGLADRTAQQIVASFTSSGDEATDRCAEA